MNTLCGMEFEGRMSKNRDIIVVVIIIMIMSITCILILNVKTSCVKKCTFLGSDCSHGTSAIPPKCSARTITQTYNFLANSYSLGLFDDRTDHSPEHPMHNSELSPMESSWSLLTIISSYIYIVKTIDKTSFLGDNKQRSSDFGTNNLVPHVHVTIGL